MGRELPVLLHSFAHLMWFVYVLRSLAMECHPDRNPGEEAHYAEVFKRVQEAYEVLLDPQGASCLRSFLHFPLSPHPLHPNRSLSRI